MYTEQSVEILRSTEFSLLLLYQKVLFIFTTHPYLYFLCIVDICKTNLKVAK